MNQYTSQARLGGWVAKMGELAGVGAVMGGATVALSQGAVALRRQFVDPQFQPSVPLPNLWDSSAGLAGFFALNANTRCAHTHRCLTTCALTCSTGYHAYRLPFHLGTGLRQQHVP